MEFWLSKLFEPLLKLSLVLKKRILRFSYIPKEESAKVLVSLNHFPFPIVASKKYRRVVLKLSWTMEPKSRLFCTNSQAEHIWRNSNLNLLWKQNMVSCLKILKKKKWFDLNSWTFKQSFAYMTSDENSFRNFSHFSARRKPI